MGQLPEARWAFEKSQQATLYSSSAQTQINQTLTSLGIDESPQEGFPQFFFAGVAFLGPIKIWISILFFTIPLLYLWKISWKKHWSIVCALLTLLPVSLGLWVQFKTTAVVVLEPVVIFDGPSQVFITDRNAEAGKKLLIVWSGNWGQVVHPVSSQGWVQKASSPQMSRLWGATHEL